MFHGLNDALLAHTRRIGVPTFDVADEAPSTLADTIRTYRERGRFRIWSGGTETAIYRDPRVNWVFRAWHDWCHVRTGLGFAVGDEVSLAKWQMADGNPGDGLALVVWSEVAEQALHFAREGDFLSDQTAFTVEVLKRFGWR